MVSTILQHSTSFISLIVPGLFTTKPLKIVLVFKHITQPYVRVVIRHQRPYVISKLPLAYKRRCGSAYSLKVICFYFCSLHVDIVTSHMPSPHDDSSRTYIRRRAISCCLLHLPFLPPPPFYPRVLVCHGNVSMRCWFSVVFIPRTGTIVTRDGLHICVAIGQNPRYSNVDAVS